MASWSRQKPGCHQIFLFVPHTSSPSPCLTPHLRLGLIISCPGDCGGLLGALSACILCPPTLHVSRPGDLERGLNLCRPSLPVQMPPPGIRDLVPAPFLPGLPLCPFPHSTCPYNFLSPAGDRPQEPRAPSRGRQRRLCAGPSPSCSVTLATGPNSCLSVAGSYKSIPSSWENKKGDEARARARTGPHPRCLRGGWGSEVENRLSLASTQPSVLINGSSLCSRTPVAG